MTASPIENPRAEGPDLDEDEVEELYCARRIGVVRLYEVGRTCGLN